MSKISDLSLPSQRNLPTKGKLETGIEILIKALKNRITKIIEQMPKTGAILK